MKATPKLITSLLIAGFVFFSCEDEKEEEVVSASIHVSAMFMNYVSGSNATMIMAYLWEGSDWTTAQAAGTVANAMFSVSTSDTINTTLEAEFEDLPVGTYYLGIFETSKMAYDADDAALKSAGYYNTSEDDYNHMMTPTGTEVSESKDYHLETMMVMSMM
jgi:hypothetical protein